MSITIPITTTSIVKIQNTTKCQWGCEAKGALMKNDTTTLKDTFHFLTKSHITLPWDAVITIVLLVTDQTDLKTLAYKKNLPLFKFYVSFIHNYQTLEAVKLSFKRWINKVWYIHALKYYLAIKRN